MFPCIMLSLLALNVRLIMVKPMLKFVSSAMFIKSVIIIVVTAGFAGGVVYYGIGTPQAIVSPQPANIQNTVNDTVQGNNSSDKTGVEAKSTVEVVEPVLKPAPEVISGLSQIMPMLMVQAEKINTVEIKDQAYLDVVSFSVSQRQYRFADAAMLKISQTELRDTARSQIVIALAMDGRAVEAFDIIDTVEIDALRDVMRLQVIEALIVPEMLPDGLLRK